MLSKLNSLSNNEDAVQTFYTSFLFTLFCLSISLEGKGLKSLKPQELDQQTPANPTSPAEPSEEKTEQAPAQEIEAPIPPSPLSQHLADRFFLEVGIGGIMAAESSIDLRSRNFTDITAGYLLETKILDMPLTATGRYLPFDVAPKYKRDQIYEEFYGIVEAYLFGLSTEIPFDENWNAIAATEIGILNMSLYDARGLQNEKNRSKLGFGVTLGGGAITTLTSKIRVGAWARIGLGTLTTYQLSFVSSVVF